MRIKPIGERVVVKKIIESKSTIIIPDASKLKQEPYKAEVVAVSTKVDDVSVGDIVLVEFFSGAEYKEKDEQVYIVNRSNILMKLGK